MTQRKVVVYGGSGFVGGYVVAALAKAGFAVQVVSRSPQGINPIRPAGNVGQIVSVAGNIRDEASVKEYVEGAYAVVNLVGVLYEKGSQNFSLHSQGAEILAKAAKAAGVEKFVQMSALGANKSTKAKYSRTKRAGEKAVIAAFPEATILRPSIIFGEGDGFFTLFSGLAKISPILPLVGGGESKFQPVYAGDVAKAVVYALTHKDAVGQIYELGGAEVRTFKELLELLLDTMGIKRCLMPLPYALASLEAFFLEMLPHPLLTRDQVKLLRTDNIVELDSKAKKISDMAIHPVLLEEVLPRYVI